MTTVEQENNYQNGEKNGVYSIRVKAGKRRTYFFDVRTTKANDYFLTITESKKRFDDDGYERHKIFLYKEDFNKFKDALGEVTDYVKTELLPDFDFDQFNHSDDYRDNDEDTEGVENAAAAADDAVSGPAGDEQVEKW